jgi:hypothetical protein
MPINWHRPIELVTDPSVKLHFVGWSLNGRQAIVESSFASLIYRADATTGHINGVGCIRNVKEPWEVAFDRYYLNKAPNFDYTEETIFRKGYEAGAKK